MLHWIHHDPFCPRYYEDATSLQESLEDQRLQKENELLQEMLRKSTVVDPEKDAQAAGAIGGAKKKPEDNRDEIEQHLIALFHSMDLDRTGYLSASAMWRGMHGDWETALTGSGLSPAEKRGFMGEVLPTGKKDFQTADLMNPAGANPHSIYSDAAGETGMLPSVTAAGGLVPGGAPDHPTFGASGRITQLDYDPTPIDYKEHTKKWVSHLFDRIRKNGIWRALLEPLDGPWQKTEEEKALFEKADQARQMLASLQMQARGEKKASGSSAEDLQRAV